MHIDPEYEFDPTSETYEDFLERLPAHMATALANDDAVLLGGFDGLKIIEMMKESVEAGDDMAAYNEWLSTRSERDLAKAYAEIQVLGKPVEWLLYSLKKRERDLHLEHCETCQKAERKDGEATDLLGRLRRLLAGDDDEPKEPWQK